MAATKTKSHTMRICLHIDHVFKEFYGVVHKIRIFKRQVDRVFGTVFGAAAATLAVIRYVRQTVFHGNLMRKTFFSADIASIAFFFIDCNPKSL